MLHTGIGLACLALALHIEDPHLLPVRPFAAALLGVAGLAAFVIMLRVSLRWRRRAPFALLWLAVLGALAHTEYQALSVRRHVVEATAHDTRHLQIVGQHLVVGYDVPGDVRELARRGFIAGIFVTRRNAEGKTAERQTTAEIPRLDSSVQNWAIKGLTGAEPRRSEPIPASQLLPSLGMRWVIHYHAPEGWRWRVLTDGHELIAMSKTAFQTNAECVMSAMSHGYPRTFKPAEDRDPSP